MHVCIVNVFEEWTFFIINVKGWQDGFVIALPESTHLL